MTVDSPLLQTILHDKQTDALRLHDLTKPEEKFNLLIKLIYDFRIIVNSPGGIKWGPQIETQQAGIDGAFKGRFDTPISQLWFMWYSNQREQMFTRKNNLNAVSQMRILGNGEKEFVQHNHECVHRNTYRKNNPDDFTYLLSELPYNQSATSILTVSEKSSSPGSLLEIVRAIVEQTSSQFNNLKKTDEYTRFQGTCDKLGLENINFWRVAFNRISSSKSLSLFGCITPASALELKRILSNINYDYHGDIILFDLMANSATLTQLADTIDGNTYQLRTRLIPAVTDLRLMSQPFGHNISTSVGILDIVGPYMKDDESLMKTVRKIMVDGISPGGILIFRDFFRKPISNNSVELKTISNDPQLTDRRNNFTNWLKSAGFNVDKKEVDDVLDNLWGPDRPRTVGQISEPYERAFADLKRLYPGSKMKLFTVGIDQYGDITDGYYVIGIVLKGKQYLYTNTDFVELPDWAEN